jgi:hypothetical protein
MRVPGSFNTKNGERLPVTVTVDSDRRYELDDLREWIAETRPLIPRKGEALGSNPFLSANIPGGGPAMDIEARLVVMAYQGAGETSIHQTQVSVTAAMLNRGVPTDEVVQAVLGATRPQARQVSDGIGTANGAKLSACAVIGSAKSSTDSRRRKASPPQ